MTGCVRRPQIEGADIDGAVSLLQWFWFLPSDAVLDLVRSSSRLAETIGLNHVGCRDVIATMISFSFWLMVVVWWHRN